MSEPPDIESKTQQMERPEVDVRSEHLEIRSHCSSSSKLSSRSSASVAALRAHAKAEAAQAQLSYAEQELELLNNKPIFKLNCMFFR